jgi:hypothetical protein
MNLIARSFPFVRLVPLALLVAGCGGHGDKPSAQPPFIPVTTTYASEPTSGCSLAQVRRAFKAKGVALIVASPQVAPNDPLLGILRPRRDSDPATRVEVTVFHRAEAARAAALKGRPGPKSRLQMAFAMNVIAVYPRTAPRSLSAAINTVVVHGGCLGA